MAAAAADSGADRPCVAQGEKVCQSEREFWSKFGKQVSVAPIARALDFFPAFLFVAEWLNKNPNLTATTNVMMVYGNSSLARYRLI